ncbi:MAG: fused MFS/spermidine synthase [Deltaproteobacteria bacterium]|nr:fused MFS/spermidine synthase [Deltaproteobacteria bacterium]
MTTRYKQSYLLRGIRLKVLICFVFSGATGLVYEVVLMKILGLIFGHTVLAVTTVLTAFMAGLALGSYLLGKIADRSRNPLLLYGFLEGGIGLYCLAIPLLVVLIERGYLALYQVLSLSHYALNLAQFGLVFFLLLPPTTLMGATLPVLSRWLAEDEATLGSRVGSLYALNTFGAVVGTAGSGYILLPIFGMWGMLRLTAILNLWIALLAIYWSRSRALALSPSGGEGTAVSPSFLQQEKKTKNAPLSGQDRKRPRAVASLTALALGISGAASMIYEVAWTRALSLTIGSSTYAFTSMLVVFLTGIALGSALFTRFLGHSPVRLFTFGALQTAIGLSALLILPIFGIMPELFLKVFRISTAPGLILTAQFVTSFAAMILPTLLIGATFPCAVMVIVRGLRCVGAEVGRIYAANTLGAVFGAFSAGFLLIPTLGAHETLKVAIFANLSVGLLFTFIALKDLAARVWVPWTAVSLAAVGATYWMPPWDKVAMSSGVAIYGPRLSQTAARVGLAQATPDSRLLFYEDGISATVTVHQAEDHTFLRINGKTDASTAVDMHTQTMLGHLALLLHPEPKSIAIVGLGSGVTAAAVSRHPVERIDVIEIEPAVIRASRFFQKVNRNIATDPRVRIVIADARNFFLSGAERYDVIISEPSNPWIRGLSTLFTREFFALARQRLKPGGAMLQWVHGYGLAPADLRMVVNTFRTAFPATTIWNTVSGDFLLLGQERLLKIDVDRLGSKVASLPGVQEDLARLGFRSGAAILADFMLDENDAERYSTGASVNTDDRLPLEFSAPLSLYLDTAPVNFRVMKDYRTKELPALTQNGAANFDHPQLRFELGMAYAAKGLSLEAIGQFEKALAADPAFIPARLELGKTQLLVNLPVKAVANFEAVLRENPQHPEAAHQLGYAYRAQQMPQRAVEYLSKSVALQPENTTYRTRLAALLNELGWFDEAITQYQAAHKLNPEDPTILEGFGKTYLQQGWAELAVEAFKKALAMDSIHRRLYYHDLGRAYLHAKRFNEAVQELLLAARYSPLSIEVLVDLATAYIGAGEARKAEEALGRALSLDSFHPAIQRLKTQGDRRK